jgi:hypothetical protein
MYKLIRAQIQAQFMPLKHGIRLAHGELTASSGMLSHSSICLLIAHVTLMRNSGSNPEKALGGSRFHFMTVCAKDLPVHRICIDVAMGRLLNSRSLDKHGTEIGCSRSVQVLKDSLHQIFFHGRTLEVGFHFRSYVHTYINRRLSSTHKSVHSIALAGLR